MLVAHDGAHRNEDEQVGAGRAVLALPLTVRAIAGGAVRVVLEGEQRGDVAVGHEPHVAAAAPVAAVGAAPGNVRLAAERHAAGTAVARLDVDLGFVKESGHRVSVEVLVRTT